MTVQRAGKSRSCFVDRFDYELRCICHERGDRDVFVNEAGPYCIIIDREYNKVELEDVGVNSTTIEAVWVTSDEIPIEKGSVLTSCGHTYRVKNSPANQYDGWTSVQLQKTCKC